LSDVDAITTGQERFATVMPVRNWNMIDIGLFACAHSNVKPVSQSYYRDAAGAFLVFSWSESKSFENVMFWKSRIDTYAQSPTGAIPVLLICNKVIYEISDETA
jgi:GTPase SAR1 family protein